MNKFITVSEANTIAFKLGYENREVRNTFKDLCKENKMIKLKELNRNFRKGKLERIKEMMERKNNGK